MYKLTALGKIALFSFLLALQVVPAHAQATRTWVSGLGDDANPCSRTAPCKTFAGAISKTAAGGEIDALDPAGYGARTITKAITIDGGGQIASLLGGANALTVAAGVNDVVIIRNLQINGVNTGTNGINFTAGAMLSVVNCSIDSFSQAGINVATSGASILNVTETTITNVANGIRLNPTGGNLFGQVDRTTLQKIGGDGISLTGNTDFSVTNSRILNSNTAVLATGSSTVVDIDSSAIFNNSLAFSTAGGLIRVTRNTIYANTNNFAIATGVIASAGNNMVVVNGATSPNGTVQQQ
jgi:hypothetical protein